VNGVITDAPEENVNPFEVKTIIPIAQEQDGSFWPISGGDVVDGDLLINKIISDINFIAFHQGWGVLFIEGMNIPKVINPSPDNAVIFTKQNPDDPPAVFKYESSNPPLGDWMDTVKMQVSMLLSSNGLAPKNIEMSSFTAKNVESGVSKLVDESEVMSSVQDTQKLYQDKEPEIWEAIRKEHKFYFDKGLLIPDLMEIKPFEDSNVKLKFNEVRPPLSEAETLDNIKRRKDLGINTMLDLIKKDNPDLSDEDAEEKLKEILTEKIDRQKQFMQTAFGEKDGQTQSEETDDEETKTKEGDEEVSVENVDN